MLKNKNSYKIQVVLYQAYTYIVHTIQQLKGEKKEGARMKFNTMDQHFLREL